MVFKFFVISVITKWTTISFESFINATAPNLLQSSFNEKIKSVEIYEETGRSVLKANATKNINTSMLKKGIYFYKLQNTNEKTISGKFVKE